MSRGGIGHENATMESFRATLKSFDDPDSFYHFRLHRRPGY